ncbi:hypothetical protein K8T06_14730 [bacterium]|nr:hypothetical protein [bacterium]
MFADIDLRKLTEITSPDRCFLSLYLESPDSIKNLEQSITKMLKAMTHDDTEKDERKHFIENMNVVRDYLEKHPIKKGSTCIYVCWLLDFFEVIPLTVKINDLVWIDSSPYVRPLAELQDEYENVAVVIADNKKARIFMVSSAVAGDEDVVHGNVKNHVRKGGWSQQRYERRRDKQLLTYSREITEKLQSLKTEENYSHILLVGGKEILREIYNNLSPALQKITAQKRSDLGKGSDSINKDIKELVSVFERESEIDLWEKIRREFLRNGLGVVGLKDVFAAVKEGKIEKMIVCRDFKPMGRRCRECSTFCIDPVKICPECSSESLFEVDAVNELVELVEQHAGKTDFSDPIETLVASGNIGALLRYK